jgi:hypothetical protein
LEPTRKGEAEDYVCIPSRYESVRTGHVGTEDGTKRGTRRRDKEEGQGVRGTRTRWYSMYKYSGEYISTT